MSRTACFQQASAPESASVPLPDLPEDFVADLHDQFDAISDVQMALDLLENLVDPVPPPVEPQFDLDRSHLGAMLRILNSEFYRRLAGARGMIGEPAEPS
jgi:hypothetical protein